MLVSWTPTLYHSCGVWYVPSQIAWLGENVLIVLLFSTKKFKAITRLA
jgi:hypothetical protein